MISRDIDLSEDLLFTKDKESFLPVVVGRNVPWINDSPDYIKISNTYVTTVNISTIWNELSPILAEIEPINEVSSDSDLHSSTYHITPSDPHWNYYSTTYNIPTSTINSTGYVSSFTYNETEDTVTETRIPMNNGWISTNSTNLSTTVTYYNTTNYSTITNNKISIKYMYSEEESDPFKDIIPFKIRKEEHMKSCILPDSKEVIMESLKDFKNGYSLKPIFRALFPWIREESGLNDSVDRKVPWYENLRTWMYEDYIRDLFEDDPDYMKYLSSTWYNPNRRTNEIIDTSFSELSAL